MPLLYPPAPLSPNAIIEDYSDEFYHICWKPKHAGIVHTPPGLVRKQDLAKQYPHVVEAWSAAQREERDEASRVEGGFIAFGRQFYDHESDQPYTEQAQRGVPCDQSIRSGMCQHWGELRKCESHPPGLPAVRICKGCRASHYAQDSHTFDRQLIMARGARVSACDDCAVTALDGAGYQQCTCDSLWTCFRCREAELSALAKARKKYAENTCGRCSKAGNLAQHVDFCMRCQGWRVYVV